MEEVAASKVCCKCGELKLLSEYHKKGKGLRAQCKTCRKLESKGYRATHKNEIKTHRDSPAYKAREASYQIVYQATHKEERTAYLSVYNELNKEAIAASRKTYYEANKEQFVLKSRQQYLANTEKIKERCREWAANNPDKVNQYSRAKRARKLGSIGSFTLEDIEEIFGQQEGKCIYCDTDLTDNFEPDHIFPISRYLYDAAENIQLLCPTCNNRKLAKEPEAYEALIGFLTPEREYFLNNLKGIIASEWVVKNLEDAELNEFDYQEAA